MDAGILTELDSGDARSENSCGQRSDMSKNDMRIIHCSMPAGKGGLRWTLLNSAAVVAFAFCDLKRITPIP